MYLMIFSLHIQILLPPFERKEGESERKKTRQVNKNKNKSTTIYNLTPNGRYHSYRDHQAVTGTAIV